MNLCVISNRTTLKLKNIFQPSVLKKLEHMGKSRNDAIPSQNSKLRRQYYVARDMGSGSAHRDAGISQHERSLSELCSPRVARAETARTPPSVDRRMSAVAHGGGRGGKGERCAARRSRRALPAPCG